MKKRQNTLGTYLALTAGVGCAATAADAAVTFYGVGAQTPASTPATPLGIFIGYPPLLGSARVDFSSSTLSYFNYSSGAGYFSSGAALPIGLTGIGGVYFNASLFRYGATAGSANYANISFNGSDGIYEAVAQFSFDGSGGGYLVAIAFNDGPNAALALSIPDGKAMIDAAAIPEPSAVALLALGAAGVLARRRRKKAA